MNEGAPKCAKAVDYQAISEIIDVKLPASYDRRKGGFSEDVLMNGSEQDRKVTHGLARNLMEGLASSVCPEPRHCEIMDDERLDEPRCAYVSHHSVREFDGNIGDISE